MFYFKEVFQVRKLLKIESKLAIIGHTFIFNRYSVWCGLFYPTNLLPVISALEQHMVAIIHYKNITCPIVFIEYSAGQ